MHQRTKQQVKPSVTITPKPCVMLQRKCACGGTPSLSGECEECRKKRLQRKIRDPRSEIRNDPVLPPIVHEVLRAPGQPLDSATRAFIEPRFGHDFSGVKVHAEPSPVKTKGLPTEMEVPPPTDEVPFPPAPEEEAEEGTESALEEATPEEAAAEQSGSPEEIEIKVVPSETPPLEGISFKAMCPAPKSVSAGFSTNKSTAAQIAAMGPCTWGITSPDPLKINTLTCKQAAVWRLRVKSVKSVIRTFSRQLGGQVEPTTGNSTAVNFCGQVTDLDSLGTCPGGNWYMLAAVKAHEAVHVEEWKTSFGSDWPAQKAIIEALNVPAVGATKNKNAATAAMRSSAAFTNALLTDTASGNYPRFWGIPDPNTNTNAAERVIASPRIKQLCVNARGKGFGPGACPVCAAEGIV